MKKFLCLILSLLCLSFVFSSCAAQKTELDGPTKEVFSDKENVKDNEDKPIETPNGDNNGNGDIDNTENTDKEDDTSDNYVKPTSFSKAYANVSNLRNDFYDILSSSLASAGEASQLFIDTYEVINGEATFLYVSACGGGDTDIIKTALAVDGYKDIEISVDDNGAYVITCEVPVSDMTSFEQVYASGRFYAYYDAESDSFLTEYKVDGKEKEAFSAKRIKGGYLAQYLSSDNEYMRFILMDDYTGKAIFCKEADWQSDIAEEGFGDVEYNSFYELTETRFHSIHNGIEYTFHKVLPDNLSSEKTDADDLEIKG